MLHIVNANSVFPNRSNPDDWKQSNANFGNSSILGVEVFAIQRVEGGIAIAVKLGKKYSDQMFSWYGWVLLNMTHPVHAP